MGELKFTHFYFINMDYDKILLNNSFKDKQVQEKKKKSLIEHYGVVVPSKSDKIKEKIKNTCLEKYGSASLLQSEEIRKKIKITNLEKYG